MSDVLELQLVPKLKPLARSVRTKVAYGGRGSGKSFTIAQLLILKSYQQPMRVLCAREIQKSINDSVLQLLSDTIDRMGLAAFFDVQKTQILGKNGTRFLFSGLRSNINEIKSMEGLDVVWVEEAESVSNHSWNTLIPTVRKPGSEIWVSFNPLDEMDATYQRFVVNAPKNSVVIKVNWPDNPWFPEVLNEERLECQRTNKRLYEHIWQGNCWADKDGAYYPSYINDKQVTRVPIDRSLPVHTFWDLGIRDSTAIWFFQVHGREPRAVNYYEASGEGLQHYISVLQEFKEEHGILWGRHIAPHDIAVRELSTGQSRRDIADGMGIKFDTAPMLPIQDGIESTRKLLPMLWFDEERCKDGLRSLKNYRKEWDDKRQTYKSHALHDWSSHGADAMRYAAVSQEIWMPKAAQSRQMVSGGFTAMDAGIGY